jgi:hypothetical protein
MGMTFGDPRYMSPEQARGETLDRRSDIYSLGAIAFEMLVGTPPYTGSGTFEILQQHLDAPVPSVRERRADVPEWLDAVVRRALAKKPDGRFVTVAQVIECLRAQSAPPALDAAQQAEHAKLTSQAARGSDPTMGKVAPAPVLLPAVKPVAPVAPAVAPVMPAPAAVPNAPAVKAAPSAQAKTVPLGSGLSSLATPANPPPAVSALAAAMGPPANAAAEPVARSPRETQSMMAAPKQAPAAPVVAAAPVVPPAAPVAATPPAVPVATAPAPKLPGVALPAENKKPKPDARRAPPDVPSTERAGSVDMTPASVPQLENVPSVVVESASGERTVPVKLSHAMAAAASAAAEPRATVPPPPPVEPQRKHDRPPTGEWFANESEPLRAGSVSAYDDLDELPKNNRGPMIIGIVAGGLLLVGGIVIALLPKPVHKPLRGEEAIAQATAPAPAAPATPPSGAASALPAAPTPPVAAPPVATPPPAPPVVAAAPVAKPAPKPIAVAAPPVTKPTSEKPAVAVERPAPPKPEPVVAHSVAKEPPAHAEKVEPKAKPLTRVASTTRPAAAPSERPTSSGKRDKSVPEGFKDPFASEPTPAKSEAAQADFFIKLGRQKLGASDLGGAASSFNKAREFDPRSAEAVAGLGEVAFEQGDYSGAVVHVKQALRLSPNRSRYLVLLGQAYYKLGKPKDAVGEYKKALRADPSNQEAQHSLDVAERKLQSGGL